ncbi:hypothetical protein T492DRAFT_1071528 [Pavlovales sp. CCMP2436]|nr:hypothetical protein T492DRAFT_1071528 [Pavlovales sp. CCMP2436]
MQAFIFTPSRVQGLSSFVRSFVRLFVRSFFFFFLSASPLQHYYQNDHYPLTRCKLTSLHYHVRRARDNNNKKNNSTRA